MINLGINPDFMSKMMIIAKNESKNSPCNRLKVGAVSVCTVTGSILHIDHNRPPGKVKHVCLETGCVDINHAEMNVLLNSLDKTPLPMGIYITHEPCSYCAKAILEIPRIKLIVFEKFYESKSGFGGGHKILEDSDITLIQYTQD